MVGIREVSADAVYNTRGRLDAIAFTEVSMFVGRELSVHSIPVSIDWPEFYRLNNSLNYA